VETHHFPPQTEMLIRPLQRHFGSDIAYTLQRYPNHHRALATIVRLGEREGTDQPQGSPRTIECWFNRAARFAPDDPVVRGLYADYLARRSRPEEAAEQLIWMERAAAGNPLTHYNIGLLYTEIKKYEEALTQAHKALELGMPNIDELRRRLMQSGHWREPSTSPLPRPASSPAGGTQPVATDAPPQPPGATESPR
jgi:tetratricopeptide (TPR) repeat protein